MINMAGFAEGFSTQAENRRRQRMELAKAFEDFKKNNPYATATDFQSWIDQNVGQGLGMGYLRGGLPSADILTRLGQEGAERRAYDEQQRALEMANNKARTQGNMNALIDDFLYGYTGNIADARTEFGRIYGLDTEALGIDLTGAFSDARRSNVIATRIQPHLQTALNLIKESNGQIDNAALGQLTGITNPDALSTLSTQARREYERYVARWKMENNTRIIGVINDVVRRGGEEGDVRTAVQNFLNGTGIDIDSFDLASAQREATRVRELEDDERERALRDRRRTAMTSLQSTLDSGPVQQQIQLLLVNNDTQALRELIQQRAQSVWGEDYDEFMNGQESATLDMLVNQYVQAAQGQQEAALQQTRDSNRAASLEAVTTAETQTREAAVDYFKQMYGDAYGVIAGEIASQYHMDSGLRLALMQAISSMPEDIKDSQEPLRITSYIRQALAPYLQANGTTVADYRRDALEGRIRMAGGFERQSYNSWATAFQSELTQDAQTFSQDLATARGITDPRQRVAYLEALQRDLNKWNTTMDGRLQSRLDNRVHWVDRGSGGFDRDGFNTLRTGYTTSVRTIREQIDNELRAAMEAANANPAGAPTAPYASTDQSSVGRTYSDHTATVDAVRAISEAAGFAYRDAATANPIMGAYDFIAGPFRLAAREINENFVMSEADEVRAEDMRTWVEANGRALVTIYQNIPENRRAQMLNDIRTMTSEQFEREYQSDLIKARDGVYRAQSSFMPFTE